MVKAELELEINKLRAEEAALRDSLHKMQALNEGLGQDKIELNKIIMQVSKQKQNFNKQDNFLHFSIISLMSAHNICFYGEISKIIPYLSPNTTTICSTEAVLRDSLLKLDRIVLNKIIIVKVLNIRTPQ